MLRTQTCADDASQSIPVVHARAMLLLLQAHGIPRTSLFLQTKFTSLDGQDRRQPLPYDARAPLAEQVCGVLSPERMQARLHTSDAQECAEHVAGMGAQGQPWPYQQQQAALADAAAAVQLCTVACSRNPRGVASWRQ